MNWLGLLTYLCGVCPDGIEQISCGDFLLINQVIVEDIVFVVIVVFWFVFILKLCVLSFGCWRNLFRHCWFTNHLYVGGRQLMRLVMAFRKLSQKDVLLE